MDDKLSRFSYYSLLLLVFALPFFRIPYGSGFADVDKKILIIFIASISLGALVLRSIISGNILLPKSVVLYATGTLFFVYLIATIFSTAREVSFVGSLLDTETFVLVSLFAVLIYLSSVIFQTLPRVAFFYLALLAGALILFLLEFGYIIFDLGFSGLASITAANLFGKWNDLGIFYGLIALCSLIFYEFAPTGATIRRFCLLTLFFSVIALLLVNFRIVWWLFGFFGLSIIIFRLVKRWVGTPLKIKSLLTLLISLISIGVLYFGSPDRPLERTLSRFVPSPLDVRPSWSGTNLIVKKSFVTNPILGVGPNLFSRAWVVSKPLSVNISQFWNIDFNFGVSYIWSSVVSVGLLGFLSWLCLILISLWTTFRTFRSKNQNMWDEPAYVYMLVSGGASLYLWLMMLFYLPSFAIIALTAIFSGICVGLSVKQGLIYNLVVPTQIYRYTKSLSVFILVGVLICIITINYLYIQKYRAQSIFERAVSIYDNSKYDSALVELNKATALDDMDIYERANADLYLAKLRNDVVLQIDKKDKQKLRDEFTQIYGQAINAAVGAVAYDESNYLNWLALGNVYEQVVTLQVEGAYDKAKQAYADAASRNPTSPLIPFAQARLEALAGKPTLAVPFLNQAVTLKENYAPVYLLASQIALSSGDLNTAIKSAKLGTSADPSDFTAFFQLGYLRYQNHEYTEAIQSLEQATALNPSYANAKYFLGLAYFIQGRVNESISQFEQLSARDQDNQDIKEILNNLRNGRAPFDAINK